MLNIFLRISHSSSEAEVIALDATLRLEGIPCLTLWSKVLDVFEDFEFFAFAISKVRSSEQIWRTYGRLAWQ